MKFLPLVLAGALAYGQNTNEKIFTHVYSPGQWDENGFSLSGSQVEITHE